MYMCFRFSGFDHVLNFKSPFKCDITLEYDDVGILDIKYYIIALEGIWLLIIYFIYNILGNFWG